MKVMVIGLDSAPPALVFDASRGEDRVLLATR